MCDIEESLDNCRHFFFVFTYISKKYMNCTQKFTKNNIILLFLFNYLFESFVLVLNTFIQISLKKVKPAGGRAITNNKYHYIV